MDVTTNVDLINRIVCGWFALGSWIVTPGARQIQQLKIVDGVRANKDTWRLTISSNFLDEATRTGVLNGVDADGIGFELIGASGTINAVSFTGHDSARLKGTKAQCTVVCERKVQNMAGRLRATFAQRDGKLVVKATFTRRSFQNVTGGPLSAVPLEVRIITTTGSGRLPRRHPCARGLAARCIAGRGCWWVELGVQKILVLHFHTILQLMLL